MGLRIRGFTMIELMAVIGIVAILSLMMITGYQDKLIRDQIAEALPLADIVKAPVAMAWFLTQTFPQDNAAAGPPAKMTVKGEKRTSIPANFLPFICCAA